MNNAEHLRFLREPDNQYIRDGEEGILHCIFNQPAPTPCYWSKDGYTIRVTGRYEYAGDTNSGDCSIRITHSTYKLDDGLWNCGTLMTSSGRGLASRQVKLTVIG